MVKLRFVLRFSSEAVRHPPYDRPTTVQQQVPYGGRPYVPRDLSGPNANTMRGPPVLASLNQQKAPEVFYNNVSPNLDFDVNVSSTRLDIIWKPPHVSGKITYEMAIAEGGGVPWTLVSPAEHTRHSMRSKAGESYSIAITAKKVTNGVTIAHGERKIKAISESELRVLYVKGVKCTGSRMHPFQILYRCTAKPYWDDIHHNCGNVMEKYMKDDNGQPANMINGVISGTFFSARLLPNGILPCSSPFGNVRMLVQAIMLLDPTCWNVWVEVLYTESVPLSWGRFDKIAATGQCTSKIGGLSNNKSCTTCNLYPPGAPTAADKERERDEATTSRATTASSTARARRDSPEKRWRDDSSFHEDANRSILPGLLPEEDEVEAPESDSLDGAVADDEAALNGDDDLDGVELRAYEMGGNSMFQTMLNERNVLPSSLNHPFKLSIRRFSSYPTSFPFLSRVKGEDRRFLTNEMLKFIEGYAVARGCYVDFLKLICFLNNLPPEYFELKKLSVIDLLNSSEHICNYLKSSRDESIILVGRTEAHNYPKQLFPILLQTPNVILFEVIQKYGQFDDLVVLVMSLALNGFCRTSDSYLNHFKLMAKTNTILDSKIIREFVIIGKIEGSPKGLTTILQS